MQTFEREYATLVMKVLQQGELRTTRAGEAYSLFGETLSIRLDSSELFPIIQGRKMFIDGIVGEFQTFMAMAQEYANIKAEDVTGLVPLSEFKAAGCNYWGQWADDSGWLYLDYGSQWNVGGQLDHVVESLKNNPHDRRMLISSWVPENVHGDILSLPCCHYAYQFYVREGKFIDILWHQRSTDVMVGLPSDIILAWLWLVHLGSLTGLTPGKIAMTLGDTHVYAKHKENALQYTDRVLHQKEILNLAKPVYVYNHKPENVYDFDRSGMIVNFDHLGKLNFEVLG